MTTIHQAPSSRDNAHETIRVRALNRPMTRSGRSDKSERRSRRSEIGLAIGVLVVFAALILGFAALITGGVSIVGSLLTSLAGA